jgi:hypothetical protein
VPVFRVWRSSDDLGGAEVIGEVIALGVYALCSAFILAFALFAFSVRARSQTGPGHSAPITGERSPSAFTLLAFGRMFGISSTFGESQEPSPSPDRGADVVTWWRPDFSQAHRSAEPEPWMARLKEACEAGYYKTEVDSELQESFPWQDCRAL